MHWPSFIGGTFVGLILMGVLVVATGCEQPQQEPRSTPTPTRQVALSTPTPFPWVTPLTEERAEQLRQRILSDTSPTATPLPPHRKVSLREYCNAVGDAAEQLEGMGIRIATHIAGADTPTSAWETEGYAIAEEIEAVSWDLALMEVDGGGTAEHVVNLMSGQLAALSLNVHNFTYEPDVEGALATVETLDKVTASTDRLVPLLTELCLG